MLPLLLAINRTSGPIRESSLTGHELGRKMHGETPAGHTPEAKMSNFLCSRVFLHPQTYTFGGTSAGMVEKFNSEMTNPLAYFGRADLCVRGEFPNEGWVGNGGD